MVEDDYLMRMIRDLSRALARVLLNKDIPMYELPKETPYTATDDLYCRIQDLLSQGNINEAENILLEETNPKDKCHQELILDFYMKLNNMDDSYLDDHDYSREEVDQGLKDFATASGIPVNLI